jgi:hypothetical protein
MPIILPSAPSISVVAMFPPMPAMNLTTKTITCQNGWPFEYKNNPLCKRGFENSIRQFLKGERFCLKNLFNEQGQQICPLGIEPLLSYEILDK